MNKTITNTRVTPRGSKWYVERDYFRLDRTETLGVFEDLLEAQDFAEQDIEQRRMESGRG